jgi:hypothetical protein
MRLPSWVPEVRRPWNPAFHDTWKAMTRTERQASFLFDCLVVLAVIVGMGLLSGCGEDTSAQALNRYGMVMEADGTIQERCDASGDVAKAFLQEGNRESYGTWRAIHAIQCGSSGPMVTG